MTNEELGAILTDIAVRNGGEAQRLEPKVIVNEARDINHPLHPRFEWDDSIAAEKHRENQARQLIRMATFTTVTPERRIIAAPMFVRDPRAPAKQPGHIPTLKVKSDEDLAREVLVREFFRVVEALKRAQTYAIVLDLTAEVDAMMAQVSDLLTQVRVTDQPQGSA